MAFGKELQRLREQEKVSRRKLAEMIGVSEDRLRKWEEMDYTPRAEDKKKIEAFFSMPIDKVARLDSIRDFLIVPGTSKIITANLNEKLAEFETRLMWLEAGHVALKDTVIQHLVEQTGQTYLELSEKIDKDMRAVVQMRFDKVHTKP